VTVVKICGVTTLDDALAAAQAGADLIGLNFYPPSPRYLTPEGAAQIAGGLREALGEACPLLGGVFVDEAPEQVRQIRRLAGLDFVQLSGDEPVSDLALLDGYAVKGLRPRDRDEAVQSVEVYQPHAPRADNLPSLLLDAYHPDLYGGTGEQASVEVAAAVRAATPRLMLAGGLTPENVAERVRAIRPWGVDVASGVEGAVKGRKDAARMRAFVEAVRRIEPPAGGA
jgi:phosphoribosylanthranilate isomerase